MTLEHRLDRLERQNRIWRRVALVALCALCGVGLIAADKSQKEFGPFKSIRAQEFKLVDQDDKMRGSMNLIDGNPAVVLFGADDKFTVKLDAKSDGARLQLNKQDKSLIDLNCSADAAYMTVDRGDESDTSFTAAINNGKALGMVVQDKKVLWRAPN